MCKVSIITSVFNTKSYLSKSIESILNQSYVDFEYIIIDNGSTDESSNIIKKYADSDSRIVFIKNDVNHSLSYARNQGLNIAKGKYIYFIDSDDYVDTNMLGETILIMEESNCDLLTFGWVMEYSLKSKKISIPVEPNYACFDNKEDFRQNCMNYLKQSTLSVPWNKIYKRELIEKYNIRFIETKLEDHHFNMDYIKNINSAIFLSNHYYHYLRSRSDSELNYVYQFDLFNKKKEHFLHTKNVIEYWGIDDKKIHNILYSYFNERLIQCIQEIISNKRFSNKEKKEKIRFILNDEEVKKSLKLGKSESFLMRLLLIPIKLNIIWLIVLEARIITFYKKHFKSSFINRRAKIVNSAKGKL